MLISKFSTHNVEVYITEFEKKYEFVFPEQYREFLLKYNGGETPSSEFKINKVSSDITGFYGVGEADKYLNYDFFERTGGLREYIEDSLLPIASTSFGDYVLIGVSDDKMGKIYFHYHDRPIKRIELTESFKTFVLKCKSEKIGHIDTVEERRASMIAKGRESFIDEGLIKMWQAEIDEYANIHQEELIL